MYNERAIKKAKQKIGLYFIDLVLWKTEELGVREVHRKYKVSPQVLENNLGNSFFKKDGNKKKLYLTEERKEDIKTFLWFSKNIIKMSDKWLSEILFYTINETKQW